MHAYDQQEHSFAPYIRILGKGKKGSRDLTRSEAFEAMKMILTGQAESVQIGAFLMLMRIKEETREELAGFVEAARETFLHKDFNDSVDLDWSSYAGKRRHLPWFLLSTLLLAENGTRILIHGSEGHTAGRIYTRNVLNLFNITPASSMLEAKQHIVENNISYLPLENFCPILHKIIELRPLLGLRSPIHTMVRLLNPFSASCSVQGIFHPGYRRIHQEACLLIGQPNAAIFKGEGGEAERNPDVECLVQSVHSGQLIDEIWPAMFARRHMKDETMDPGDLLNLWQGNADNEFGEASVIGTAAIALRVMGKAESPEHAMDQATQMWSKRNKKRFS